MAIFRQTDGCAGCGDCTNGVPNGQLPDFYARAIGAARIGGVLPTMFWVGDYTTLPTGWQDIEPLGSNTHLFRKLEITIVVPNGDPVNPGITTQYQRFLWHPVMGDMYWLLETRTSSPALPSDYRYEWKLQDDCTLFVDDSTGSGDTSRHLPLGMGMENPVLDGWSHDLYQAHELNNPGSTIEFRLNDPVDMNDAFLRAKVSCNEVSIEPDNITITIDGSPSTATSNLTDDFATIRSARVVRTDARNIAGGVGKTVRNEGDDAFSQLIANYGAGVVLAAEFGSGVVGCCYADQLFGPFNFSGNRVITAFASKIKFAFHRSGWCLKKYQMQICVNNESNHEPPGDGNPCVNEGCLGGYVDATGLYMNHYHAPEDNDPTYCFRPQDTFAIGLPGSGTTAQGRLHLTHCESINSGGGDPTGTVSDLPQPCTSGTDHCAGDMWIYDYNDCPMQGVIIFDGTNCGADCGCTTLNRNPAHAMPPDFI